MTTTATSQPAGKARASGSTTKELRVAKLKATVRPGAGEQRPAEAVAERGQPGH